MIVVKLMGGLGNQLFQYAAGKALAMHHKVPLKLNLTFLNEDAGDLHTKRELALDVFNLDYSLATDEDLRAFISQGFIKNAFQTFFPVSNLTYKVVNEKGFTYNPDFFTNPKNTYLNGFWQSEKYFWAIRETLLREIVLKEAASEENLKVAELIRTSDSVSLHIRRGDYVTNKNAQTFHGTLSLDYYREAINYLNSKFTDLNFFIFSDDISWAKKNLKLPNKTLYVDFNSGKKSAFDLYLMSLCKHNIIANSSFSWWGAWLNQHKHKECIAPASWFLDKTVNTKDLIPGSWIKL